MRSTLRGVVLVVLATVLFVTMNSAVKYLGAYLPTVELIWARTLAHLIFMVAVFAPTHGGWRLFVTRRPGLQLGRSLLLLVSTSLFFTALKHVPLAEATAVSFTSPFMVPCSRAGCSASVWDTCTGWPSPSASRARSW